jgi:acetyl esterase/lipase
MPKLTRREMVAAVLAGAAATSIESTAAAAPGEALSNAKATLPLYVGPIPGAIEAPDEEATREPKEPWIYRERISRPTLTVFLPAQARAATPAVVICPGGSYKGASIDKEGYSVAQAFNRFGVAGIVLKYRTPSPRHMKETWTGPLQDVQQAMSVVRARAGEWNIDQKLVGIVGFSAGGHLAASASTLFAQPVLSEHASESVRPAFSVLVYPVISMQDELTHAVSRAQLLGPSPSPELIRRFSTERAVTDATPPAFLIHAADDESVVVGNSLRYFESLVARKISAQLLAYPHGGHGFGLINATTPDRWIDRVQLWMMGEGWIGPAAPA